MDDPHLMISPDKPRACGEITISASGAAAVTQPECVGAYTPTQMFSEGRQVFKHKTEERYLLVDGEWNVRESVEWGTKMRSGSAPSMCPADPRARINEWLGQTSWVYTTGFHRKDKNGDITVKCSVHKYLEDVNTGPEHLTNMIFITD